MARRAVSKGKMLWKAIPLPVKIGGGIVLGVGTFMLFRPRDKPPKLIKNKAKYIEKGKVIDWSPTPLANDLYTAMSGTNWMMLMGVAGDQEAAWTRLYSLPDPQKVRAVYDEYARIAKANKDNLTLTQRIRDEYSSPFGIVKPKLLIKLEALQLM